MPVRSRICLEDIAEWENLHLAAYLAARGKRYRAPINDFMKKLNENLAELQSQILDRNLVLGGSTTFQVFDPKIRTIHAPIFKERVLHHAVINHVGPVLDRSLVDDTFACRTGKGTIAAVLRVQHHSRRFPWFGKLDVRQYFSSINHEELLRLLNRKFKNREILELLKNLVDSFTTSDGTGLPIGALTSQHFANFYLNGLDRLLLEQTNSSAIVRYMDDVVWWTRTKEEVKQIANEAKVFLNEKLGLEVRQPMQINRSSNGISFCGFRIFPGKIRLSRRRKNRYRIGRTKWETRYGQDAINAGDLQKNYASVVGLTLHADAVGWRREELSHYPPVDV